MTKSIQITLVLPTELAGLRLDQALAKSLPDYSRTEIRHWIDQQNITVNGLPPRASTKVHGEEVVIVTAEPKKQPIFIAEAIPLTIVHEDDAIIILNKPAGMVVHPAAGNPNRTLLNALLHHCPALADLPRAGIIHRLDRATSGLLVIAKTVSALKQLTIQMRARSVKRIYQAIVTGVPISGGTVDAPIGRHPIKRKQMSVTDMGKPSVTHYRIAEKYRHHARLRVELETGRTHQIRVHMAHIRHPLIGDPVYGGRLQLPKGASAELVAQLRQFKRQALHAETLGLIHPITKAFVQYDCPLPADMTALIEALRHDTTEKH